MNVGIIIVAAGSGTRMGDSLPKQFLRLAGVPIVERTLQKFRQLLPEARIVVVLPQAHLSALPPGDHLVCAGGETRFRSVKNGLSLLSDCELIVVHDAVRPLFTEAMLREAIRAASERGAAIPVVAPVDSLRRLTGVGSEPVDRADYRCVQTPQAFRAELLRRAYDRGDASEATDDASVVERLGTPVALIAGDRRNIKITTPDDLLVAETFLTHEPL